MIKKIIIKEIENIDQLNEISEFINTQFTTDRERKTTEIIMYGDYGTYATKVNCDRDGDIVSINVEIE